MRRSEDELKALAESWDEVWSKIGEYDFLEWAIDCSFEMDELTILTEEKIKRYMAAPAYKAIKDRPDMVMHAFKSVVEHNLMIRQAKWLSAILALGGLIRLIF